MITKEKIEESLKIYKKAYDQTEVELSLLKNNVEFLERELLKCTPTLSQEE